MRLKMKLLRRSGYALLVCGVFFLAYAFSGHDSALFVMHRDSSSSTMVRSSVDVSVLPPMARDTHAVVSGESYLVVHVVDGDTFDVLALGERVRVRVLGINTPETVDQTKSVGCYGPEASARAKELLLGQSVQIELEPERERTDNYGRLLAYVWLPDGTFYNDAMIREGYARELTVGRAYSNQREFREAQTQARTAKLGLWDSCASN